jgi:hypothetical protein
MCAAFGVASAMAVGGAVIVPTVANAARTPRTVAAPALKVAPTISGTYAVGGALTTTDGTFSGSGLTDTIQWARTTGQGMPGAAIAGATGASYTLTAADAGYYVYSLVTATNSAGKASGYGWTTQTVAAAPAVAAPALKLAPTISGTYAVGGALTTTSGTFSGSGLTDTIQWARTTQQGVPGTAIAGATGSSYTLTAGDAGDYVYSLVTATNSAGKASGYGWTTQTVAAPPAVAAPALMTAPTISGTYAVGSALTTTNGTFSGSGLTDTIQWARTTQQGVPGTAIAGATGASYTLTAADAGDYVYSLVTATNSAGKASGYGWTTQAVPSSAPSGSTNVAQFHMINDEDSTTAAEAGKYQIVQMQWSPTAKTLVDQIHAADPGVKVLMYSDPTQSGSGGTGDGWITCTTSTQDAAGGNAWRLYDGASQISGQMNMGNASYDAACASSAEARAKASDFDGVFWDEINAVPGDAISQTCINAYQASSCSIFNGGSDATWDANTFNLIQAIGSTSASNGLMSILNIGNGYNNPAIWQQWNGPVSGAMEEGFVGNDLGASVPYSQWQGEMANEQWSEANGKYEMAVHYDPGQNQESLDTYGLASMLLNAGGMTSYSSTVTSLNAATYDWWPEYTAAQNLGAPLGAATSVTSGSATVYERKFTNGMVVVNPTTSASGSLSLGATYKGSGNEAATASSLTLPAQSGMILTN